MRYELEPNQYAMRLYDGSETDYIASATVRVYGDRSFVSQISSPRLFDGLRQYFDEVLSRLGVKTMEGYMSPSMARALRMKSKSWADFQITHYGDCAGRTGMPWVVLKRKGEDARG